MNVEISKDCKDKIYIYENDNDLQLAKAFQQKHNLPDKALKVLHLQIKLNRETLRPNTSGMRDFVTPRE